MRKSLLVNLLFFLGILPVVYCQTQSSFRYNTVLDKISVQGFYKVILLPSVVGKCNNALTDIRILNEKGGQVPYILQTDRGEFNNSSFVELPILSIKKEADKLTHVIIENRLNTSITEILLIIKNTEADRSVNISGSDDNKSWFIIKENVPLNNITAPDNDDRFIQSLNFPSSSYKYFSIVINGKDLLPVNIMKAGVYQSKSLQNKYLAVPSPRVSQKDSSNKISYISVQFDDDYLISKIELTVQGAKYFRRNLRIHNDVINPDQWQKSFTIRSAAPTGYSLNVKTKVLTLEITNDDNPPLTVSSVKAYQLNKSLLAYLDAGVKYELVFGDPDAKAPDYDLGFFKDSITDAAAVIGIGPIIRSNVVKNLNKPVDKSRTLILWIVIIGVLALLLTLTLQMTKEIKKKEGE